MHIICPKNHHISPISPVWVLKSIPWTLYAPRIFEYKQSGVNQIMEKIPLEMKELRQWSRGLRLPSDPEKSRTMELNSRCKKWIFNTWHLYQPEWFITLLWNDCPTDPVKASSHTRILRRMMLECYFGVKNMSKVPEFPERPAMMIFHERTVSQAGKVTFHTHMHLSNTDGRWGSSRDIEEFVRISGANVKKLLYTTSEGNKGVESIAWHQISICSTS